MREIFCNDKECHLLPSSQSTVDTERVNTSSASTADPPVPDSTPEQVPLPTIKTSARRKPRKKKNPRKRKDQLGGLVKRLRQIQIGGKSKRKSKKTKRAGGKKKRVKRKR